MTGPDGIEISKAELHAMLTKAAAEGARQARHATTPRAPRGGRLERAAAGCARRYRCT